MAMGDRAGRRALQEEQRRAKVLQSMDASATDFLVVRHGETDWNRTGRLQGQLDPGLNENGWQQARQLAEHFKNEPLDVIYSSDLARAFCTARAIAEARGGQEVVTIPTLRERHLGCLQGLTLEEAHGHQAGGALRGRPDVPLPGGGESADMLRDRVAAALESVAAQHPGKRVLVVAHGGVIQSIHRNVMGYPHASRVHNASIHHIRVQGNRWAIISWDMPCTGAMVQADGFGGGADEG